MDNIKTKTPIIFMSVFVFSTFIYVSMINIFPNKSSDSYLTSETNPIDAKIETTTFKDGKLIVSITGDAKKGCIKSTKTNPNNKSTCWTNIEGNKFSTSVLKNKTYYIWLMDETGEISNRFEYNQKK